MRRLAWIVPLVLAACSSTTAGDVGSSGSLVRSNSDSSTSSTSPTTVAATTTSLAPIELTFAFTGDTLVHSPLWVVAAESMQWLGVSLNLPAFRKST